MAIQEFQDYMLERGVSFQETITPGKLHRGAGVDKKPSNKSAWCKLFDDCKGGVFGDFSSGLFETWQAKRDKPYTEQERQAFKDQCERDRLAREVEATKAHAAAAQKAAYIWRQSTPITAQSQHPYLIKKRIQPYTARLFRDVLVVPIYDENRQLVNLQFIDSTGTKRFLSGGKKKGCFWWIGQRTDTLLIAEGFSTAASVFEDTGLQTFIAFDAGNLVNVAEIVRAKRPDAEIIIMGDNDENGTGQRAARAAALACGGKYLLPPIIGDWNDYLTMGARP